MRAIKITELRNNLPKYLHRVQHGDEILVTLHGQVIARIVPPIDVKAHAQQELKKLRKTCKVGDVISPLNEEWDASK